MRCLLVRGVGYESGIYVNPERGNMAESLLLWAGPRPTPAGGPVKAAVHVDYWGMRSVGHSRFACRRRQAPPSPGPCGPPRPAVDSASDASPRPMGRRRPGGSRSSGRARRRSVPCRGVRRPAHRRRPGTALAPRTGAVHVRPRDRLPHGGRTSARRTRAAPRPTATPPTVGTVRGPCPTAGAGALDAGRAWQRASCSWSGRRVERGGRGPCVGVDGVLRRARKLSAAALSKRDPVRPQFCRSPKSLISHLNSAV